MWNEAFCFFSGKRRLLLRKFIDNMQLKLIMMTIVSVAICAFSGWGEEPYQGEILFSSNFIQQAGYSDWNIYLINSDGSNLRRLTPGKDHEVHPSWSPDGKRIAFISIKDVPYQPSALCVMNADGSNPIKLTDENEDLVYTSWSPDGQRIAFLSRKGIDKLWVINANGTNRTLLVDKVDHNRKPPSWSPDGKNITYCMEGYNRTYDVFVVDVQNHARTNLTNTEEYELNSVWSPDGKYIAFFRFPNNNSELWVMNSDGTNQRKLADMIHEECPPSWSPDSKSIVYISKQEKRGEVCIVNLEDINPRRLTDNKDAEKHPKWSPDGNQILFTKRIKHDLKYNDVLHVIYRDGTGERKLHVDTMWDQYPSDHYASWRPTFVSKKPDTHYQVLLLTPQYVEKKRGEEFKITGRIVDEHGNGVPGVEIGVEDDIRNVSSSTRSGPGGYFEYPEKGVLSSSEIGMFGLAFYLGLERSSFCTINVGYQIPSNLDNIYDMHIEQDIFPAYDLSESERLALEYKFDIDLRGMGGGTLDRERYELGTTIWSDRIGSGPPIDPMTILSYSIYGGMCVGGTLVTGGTGAVFACAPLVAKAYKDGLHLIADRLYRYGKISEITRINLKASSHFVGTFVTLVYNPNVDRNFIDIVSYTNNILGGLFDLANVEEVEVSEGEEEIILNITFKDIQAGSETLDKLLFVVEVTKLVKH